MKYRKTNGILKWYNEEDGTAQVISQYNENNTKLDIFSLIWHDMDVLWMKKLTITELMIFMLLSEHMNRENRLTLSKVEKDIIITRLNIAPNVYYLAMRKLQDKDFIIKLSYSDFMVNPVFLTKGDIKMRPSLSTMYENLKSENIKQL